MTEVGPSSPELGTPESCSVAVRTIGPCSVGVQTTGLCSVWPHTTGHCSVGSRTTGHCSVGSRTTGHCSVGPRATGHCSVGRRTTELYWSASWTRFVICIPGFSHMIRESNEVEKLLCDVDQSGVNRCCCCACLLSAVPPSTGGNQVNRPRRSRHQESTRAEKSAWRDILHVFLSLRKMVKKIYVKMGHLSDLRHRLRRIKKVLYACKEMSSSMGEAMAAARDRATRYSSVQQDTTLGLPYQVPRPDGEERHHTRKHLTGSEQEAEIMREYIKPPANKTLFDVDTDGPHRSCSVGVFPTQPECGASHPGVTYHHRHSAPLETRSSHHPAVSASSSSSSLPGWGCGDDGRGSPRRGRKAGGSSQKTPLMLTPFSSSSKYERAPHSSQQEGGRRGSQHQGRLGTSSPSPSRDPSISLPYCPSTNTLADITMVSVPCGPSTHSSSSGHLGGPGGFQGAHMGSLGLPGDLPIMYGQSSDSPCSPTADHDLPPLYSDVMESSSLYTSASRPSEQRTKSGEI
ncbi:uncharacterized protein [Cherax quadricarinatus]